MVSKTVTQAPPQQRTEYMKKFFHPLLISLAIAIFPIISQAVEVPQGYLMTITSVWLGNVGSTKNTTLEVHVLRALNGTKSAMTAENTVSVEHYVFDTWNNISSYEEEYRHPIKANVFLPMEAMVNNSFYVCIQMRDVGQSCNRIKVSKERSSLYLTTGQGKPSFAVMRFALTKAKVLPMNTVELMDSKSDYLTLARLDSSFVHVASSQVKNFQVRLLTRKQELVGFFEKPHFDISQTTPLGHFSICLNQNTIAKVFSSSDLSNWKPFPSAISLSEPDSSAAVSMQGTNAEFKLNFFKVVSPAQIYNWQDRGEPKSKGYNWLDMGDPDALN